MPISLKQLEAFYWIATLGGVSETAQQLNLAQSTVSKRLIELETSIGTALFQRSGQKLWLNAAGKNALPLAKEILGLETKFKEAAGGANTFKGPLRLGTTELVALTWLPSLVVGLKEEFPNVIPIPEVAASVVLIEKLQNHELDIVIGLDPPHSSDLIALPLGYATLEWVAAPNFGPKEEIVRLEELASYPVLSQTRESGLQRLVLDWAIANGIKFNQVVLCNTLNVLAGLAAGGLGVSFLPIPYFLPEVESGCLKIIKTNPAIPPLLYHAVFRKGDNATLPEKVAVIAQRYCDFTARSIPR